MYWYGFGICLFLAIISQGFAYDDCGSVVGSLEEITISGCSPNKRCVLKRGTDSTLVINFNLKEPVQNVTSVVHGVILGVPVPFALPKACACENPESKITCPMDKGGPYSYTVTMPIDKKYPRVTVDIKWEMKNEKDEDIICVIIPAKIA